MVLVRRRWPFALVGVVGLLGGCIQSAGFACDEDSDCVASEQDGICEVTGWCSFPDSSCATGRRYGEHAGAGVASACVEPPAPDGGPDASGPDAPGFDAGTPDAGPTLCFSEPSAGYEHSCLRRSDGQAWCWGNNVYGQLSSSDPVAKGTPVPSQNLPPVVNVAAGGWFTCYRSDDAQSRCAGNNYWGNLGDGTLIDHTIPAIPNNLGAVDAVVAGVANACVVAGGLAWCWGLNDDQQLGTASPVDNCATDSTSDCALEAVQMPAVSGIAGLAIGNGHMCAILAADGSIQCWGRNYEWQLGQQPPPSISTAPLAVGTFTGAAQLALGNRFSCVRLGTGAVWCWGENTLGQAGAGSTAPNLDPQPVAGIADAVDIAAGWRHACAVRSDGSVWCWGHNGKSQLGLASVGDSDYRDAPVAVSGISNAVRVFAGDSFSCALRNDSAVFCWGSNNEGALGQPVDTVTISETPLQVPVTCP